ncbi:MAG: hypothetical protein IKP77_00650 [Acholeplasmatales bacterium]|nr:hypothetical protein [Acholeplasmatales bacterium]
MLKASSYMLRRYWYLIILILLISVPLAYLGIYRTNRALILKGGTTEFSDIVTIDTDYKSSGSFSTLYVINMEKSTKLQNIITANDPTIESYEMSSSSAAISDFDSYKAGKIQYESSIQNALILAYNEASKENDNVKINYSLSGYDVTYYGENSQFKIGDRIIKIIPYVNDYNEVLPSNEDMFRYAINHRYVNDKYVVLRGEDEVEIVLTENDIFSACIIYNIDKDNTYPKFNIGDSNVGGPSGGLLQALSIYNRLVSTDYTYGLKIAGTGTIDYLGQVGAIGGIKEKVPTAVDNNIDVFFCPSINYEDALLAYNSLPNSSKMKLVKIDTFYDALNYLKENVNGK